MRNVLFVGLAEVQGGGQAPHECLPALWFVTNGGERRAGVRGAVQGGVRGGGGVVVHGEPFLDVGKGSGA